MPAAEVKVLFGAAPARGQGAEVQLARQDTAARSTSWPPSKSWR